jgi:hypothetical protein
MLAVKKLVQQYILHYTTQKREWQVGTEKMAKRQRLVGTRPPGERGWLFTKNKHDKG